MTHYFTDKQTLVHDVIRHQATGTLAEHQALELEGFATFASLRLWADLVLERQRHRHCQGGCNFGSLAGQLVESNDETRADLADGFHQWLDLFVDGLRRMRANGDLTRDTDPVTLAYVLLGGMQGGMLLTQTLRDTDPLEAAFDSAFARVAEYATNPTAARRALRVRKSRRA
jgi:TetR/AcrR family transcriptional repressor of nem operon